MFKTLTAKIMFSLAGLCGVYLLWLTIHTGLQVTRYGATPNSEGIASGIISLLGTLGFSIAGVINAILNRAGSKTKVDDSEVALVAEISVSFLTWARDVHNLAKARRFFFAIADAAGHLPGVVVTNEGGILIIKFSGWADPSGARA